MTGDDNGRWGGEYFLYPADYGAYLENVVDTVVRLRGYASLVFYSGCNECAAPRSAVDGRVDSPPRNIDDGIQKALERYFRQH